MYMYIGCEVIWIIYEVLSGGLAIILAGWVCLSRTRRYLLIPPLRLPFPLYCTGIHDDTALWRGRGGGGFCCFNELKEVCHEIFETPFFVWALDKQFKTFSNMASIWPRYSYTKFDNDDCAVTCSPEISTSRCPSHRGV